MLNLVPRASGPAASAAEKHQAQRPAATAATTVQVSPMPKHVAASAAQQLEAVAQSVVHLQPRTRPWRSNGSGRLPERGRQLQLDVSSLINAAVAWEEEQRLQAERAAAKAAAAAEAAAAALEHSARQEQLYPQESAAAQIAQQHCGRAAEATPAAQKIGHASISTPGSHWTPIEGVPELRSRPRRRPPARAPAATPPGSLAFTPVEGVPETARGFRKPPASAARAPVPRFTFTPIEGVPEKAFTSLSSGGGPAVAVGAAQRAARAMAAAAEAPVAAQRQLVGGAATYAGDDSDDSGGYGDYGGDDYGGDEEEDEVARAQMHVTSMVQGLVATSPDTPSHPLQLATSGGTAGRARSGAAAAAATPGIAGADGPSPMPRLTPEMLEGGGATGEEHEQVAPARRSNKRSYVAVQTPREGRWAKSRKSLAAEGTHVEEDGIRRSKRVKHKPLEYWRNEHKEMCRVHTSLPTVRRIAERTPDPAWPAEPGDITRRAARSKPRSRGHHD